jgi:hypothetical protein
MLDYREFTAHEFEVLKEVTMGEWRYSSTILDLSTR